jgi:hypothetical protein
MFEITAIMPLITHPAMGALLFVLLAAWPVARILQRRGHHPAYAVLLVLNFVLPMLGLILLCALLCRTPRVKQHD